MIIDNIKLKQLIFLESLDVCFKYARSLLKDILSIIHIKYSQLR
jgi:hypothetical protein